MINSKINNNNQKSNGFDDKFIQSKRNLNEGSLFKKN